VDPTILAGACRHGVGDEDMLHAYRHPIRVFEVEGLVLPIGADRAGRLLEVGVVNGAGIEFIVHAYACPSEIPEVRLMPRSIQEILDHAERLVRHFEEYAPAEGDEVPVEEYLLRRAVLGRARSERQVLDAVAGARAAGIPWSRVGRLLGTSAQAAQQRYGSVADRR
jgi:hypothetical protein